MITYYKESCPFVDFIVTLSTNHGQYKPQHFDQSFIPLLVFPISAHPGRKKFGYKPENFTKDIVGNHDCHHDNLTGTVLSFPGITKDSYGFHLQPVTKAPYTHVIDLSNRGTLYFTQHSEDPTYYGDTQWNIHVSESQIEFVTSTLTYRNNGTIYHRTIFRNLVKWEFVPSGDATGTLRVWSAYSSSAAYDGDYPKMPSTPILPNSPKSYLCMAENGRILKSSAVSDKLCLASIKPYILQFLPYNEDRLLWGRLSQDACNASKVLQQNLIATIKDFKELPLLIKSIRDLLAKKVDPKTLADAYLTIKYAILPTIQDSKEIYSAVNRSKSIRKSYCTCRARTTTQSVVDGLDWSTSYNLKVYYLQEDVFWISLLRDTMAIGLFPSLENVWDFVPFSFAFDWFIDFGGLLEDIDTKTYLSTLPIVSVIQTKCDRTSFDVSRVPLASVEMQGLISFARYRRDLATSLLPPLLELNISKNPFDHIVEGAALLMQRKK